MISLSHEQIDAIRFSSALNAAVSSILEDPSIATKLNADISAADWLCLKDACVDALCNVAPVVEELYSEQDNGPYLVSTVGVPGAYIVIATEFDTAGAFSSLSDARNHIEFQHGEFLIQTSK